MRTVRIAAGSKFIRLFRNPGLVFGFPPLCMFAGSIGDLIDPVCIARVEFLNSTIAEVRVSWYLPARPDRRAQFPSIGSPPRQAEGEVLRTACIPLYREGSYGPYEGGPKVPLSLFVGDFSWAA